MSSLPLLLEPTLDEVWEIEDEFDEERELPTLTLVQSSGLGNKIESGPRGDLKAQFAILAEELEEATAGLSSTRRATRHPAYTGILALGDDAIPLLLDRLQTSRARPILLRLLGSLTPYQPGVGKETIEEAAAEWVRWGKREGRID